MSIAAPHLPPFELGEPACADCLELSSGVFDFVKMQGEWRVSNSMWTVEPDAGEALRARDVGTIRPAG